MIRARRTEAPRGVLFYPKGWAVQVRRYVAAVAVLAVVALVACGGDSTGPAAPISIGGVWQFSDNISSTALGISCANTGPVSVAQTGANFSGSSNVHQVCTDGVGGVVTGDAVVAVTGGQISGSSVSFQTDGCQYTGHVSGSPANAMSGQESCTFAFGGTNYLFTGPWQASR